MIAPEQLQNGIQDNLYPGLSRTEYERIEAVNYSTLKHFRRTPAHAREYMLHPPEPTEALDFGAAFHCALLEPQRFAEEYVAAPHVDRRTKAGKDAWLAFEADNKGKELLAADDMETIKCMSEACFRNQLVGELLSLPSKSEVAVVWTDAKTGLRCKALLDRTVSWLRCTTIIDAKTCQDAGPWAFARDAARYAYFEQAAWYLEGLDALRPATRRFLWIAVEKSRPHCAAVYEPDPESLDQGRKDFRRHLDMHARCLREGLWPGYAAEVRYLSLPNYALNNDTDEEETP